MRIYAVADIHGREERLSAIAQQVAAHCPDFLVVAGDISRRRQPVRALAALNRLGLPVYWVGGNSDSQRMATLCADYPNLHDLHLNRVRQGGIDLVGVGGCLPLPFASRLAWREQEIVAHLSDRVTPQAMLVAHPPPNGACDRVLGHFHAGSRALRRLVMENRPALMICGHIHEQAGVEQLGGTLVINCALGPSSRGALIDYDGRSAPDVRMLE